MDSGAEHPEPFVLAYGRDVADMAFISDYGSAPLEVQVTVNLSPT